MINCLVSNLSVLFVFIVRTIIFDHAELALHNYYGGQEYWMIRKSMAFSNNLHEIAKEFKKTNLKQDYLCVHLRRRDFLYGHPSDVPSIKNTAKQIIEKLSLLNNIKTLYVATDASKLGKYFFLLFIKL